MISHCFVTFVLYNLAFSWNIWIYITKNIKDHFNIEKQQTNLNWKLQWKLKLTMKIYWNIYTFLIILVNQRGKFFQFVKKINILRFCIAFTWPKVTLIRGVLIQSCSTGFGQCKSFFMSKISEKFHQLCMLSSTIQ